MKFLRYIAILLLLFNVLLLNAQQYTNHWINHNQSYYKIKIAEDGVYQLDYNTLQNYGFPVSSVNPLNIQIFSKGVEQPIFIQGENDGTFDSGDYIEFYAEANDGWLDSELYIDPSTHVNKDYSLFTDTAVYYLTWNNSTANNRMLLVNNTNYNSYPEEDYYTKVVREEYTSRYHNGKPEAFGVTDAEYTAGEGWLDNPFNLGGSRTKTVNTPSVYSVGPQAKVRFAVVGASDYEDTNGSNVAPDHHLRVTFANQVLDTLYDGYVLNQFQYNVSPSYLNNANDFVFSSINDLGVGADRNAVSYIEIEYPRTPSLNNQDFEYFYVDDITAGFRRIDFSGLNATASAEVYVYDLSNGKRIEVSKNGTEYQALIPNGGGNKRCFLTSTDNNKTVNKLYPVSNTSTPNQFTNYSGLSAEYIIISHKDLIESSSQSVQNYANYRSSNGLNTLIVDVDDLYDQFSYGIHNHPYGIRKFIEYIWDNFNSKPEFLYLLGKGYRASDDDTREGVQYHTNLVPSMGNPPSDILYSSGIVDSLYQPALATGRLSAKNTDHIDLYLDKVQEFDAARNNPEAWQKRILHFAGGKGNSEQAMIQNFLSNYASIARDTFLGAQVHTFKKTTTDPIEINKVEKIREYINSGVSLMTFFGHASGVSFDISIEDPGSYDNQGKYPFLLANSCYSGDLFQPSLTSSEEWILAENRGVIGYIASISRSVASTLNAYSTSLYRNFSNDLYGQPIGKITQRVIKDIQYDVFSRKQICQTMTLHGDPAVSLYHHTQPDYSIEPSDISFNPTIISTEVDSFQVNVAIKNIGRAVRDSFFVEIKRLFPNNNVSTTKLLRLKTPYFADTVSVKLPVNQSEGIGLNTLEVTLDSYNGIAELSEANNFASVDFNIKSTNIIPVYPQRFAIVPGPDVKLKASSSNPFSIEKDFVFQLDTTPDFNSPVFLSTTIQSKGGVIEWIPPVSLQDSMVYYWRVSIDSVSSGNYDWRRSSFQYIDGKNGWAQAHFPQFEPNDYQFINQDFNNRKFRFINLTNEIFVKTGVYPNVDVHNISFSINNDVRRFWTCLKQHPDYIGMLFVVFDTLSGEPFLSRASAVKPNGLGEYNNVHCSNGDLPTIEFFTNSTVGYSNLYEAPQSWWFNSIINFIDSLPAGTPVLAYSAQNHNAENYTNQLYQAFESIGSSYIRTINNDQPYIIFGKKGYNIGDANEAVGLGPQDKISLKDSVKSRWKEGYIKSPLIGPSKKWKSLHWDFSYSDSIPVDYVELDVVGIKTDGTVDTVINNLSLDSTDVNSLDSYVNAQDYPWLQLIMKTRDDSLNTPAQLKKWQVMYAGVPETAINPQKGFSFYSDTVMQGDTIKMSLATENISRYDMDSLKVKYWIVDHNRTEQPINERKLRPHPSGDVLIDTITFDTRDLRELNKLWVEFNPDEDQHELTHINNIAELPFYVKTDVSNPLLDVTFDGVHIMDGDIVSARPHILITLKDENKYLALEDTNNVSVFLKTPSQQSYKRLNFSSQTVDQLVFQPASLPENECEIEYQGDFQEDGIYNLRVQAKDESGNKSGNIDYDINFEVVNKSTITNVLNWPNPFSTRTHFVFTLTGSRVPDYMKIQIMTVTGKVVREIEMDELGPIHIGKNVTDYAWDGTDEFGDRLANGVYLYRVITDMNGESIEKRNSAADQFFKKGFGKMYLIR